ncbi:MAG: HAMP domain-containing sensor histidine kinase [Hespellia sp.]|nr:HAMP domain-containing sensor histidine kinase [Hespellia sp.]
MKKSLKKQMIVVFVGLIVFVLAVVFAVNSCFLEKYYIANKQGDLAAMYESLEEAIEEGNISDSSVQSDLSMLSERANISAMVVAREDIQDGEVMPTFMTAREDNNRLFLQLLGYVYGKNQNQTQVIGTTDTYEIQETSDPVSRTKYIELWGTMSDSNYYFLMRSPLESIQESAEIANRFLIYIGSAAVLFSVLAVWYFAKKITRPILELVALSQKMAGLDFEAKYSSGGSDEIGILGANFNTMSTALETTISELKSANFELQKDIEKKDKLEAMRTEFLGNVSHELKTPIALIQGYAEGLKEGVNDDPESREFYCDVIMDEANKMNQMVKNLLTLNQLEFGEDDTQFARFDVTAIISGVLQSLDILIRQADATVEFVDCGPTFVWADEFKTEQVIRNYLTNAIHHAGNEKRIEVRLARQENHVRISVFNSGMPIPEEDIPKLWDKFYKVDKAHTREYGGNGIGLSIVKAIMESFHQQYGVKNFDNGVEFWFELDTK